MRRLSVLLIGAAAFISGCSSVANNTTTNANMRGTNTNTGYMANSDTNAKPTMPTNVTNISPPSMSSNNTSTSSSNSSNADHSTSTKSNTNTNTNTKKP